MPSAEELEQYITAHVDEEAREHLTQEDMERLATMQLAMEHHEGARDGDRR